MSISSILTWYFFHIHTFENFHKALIGPLRISHVLLSRWVDTPFQKSKEGLVRIQFKMKGMFLRLHVPQHVYPNGPIIFVISEKIAAQVNLLGGCMHIIKYMHSLNE